MRYIWVMKYEIWKEERRMSRRELVEWIRILESDL